MNKNSVLILKTPNCFAFRHIMRTIIQGTFRMKKDHICWFDMTTLKQLAERENFTVINKFYTFNSSGWRYVIEKFASFFHKEFAPILLVVLEKKSKEK